MCSASVNWLRFCVEALGQAECRAAASLWVSFPGDAASLDGLVGSSVAALKIREQRLEGAQVFRSAPKLFEQIGRSLPAEGWIRVNGGVAGKKR